MLNINDATAVTDTCGFRFSSKDSTSGGINDIERFVIENGAAETKGLTLIILVCWVWEHLILYQL